MVFWLWASTSTHKFLLYNYSSNIVGAGQLISQCNEADLLYLDACDVSGVFVSRYIEIILVIHAGPSLITALFNHYI